MVSWADPVPASTLLENKSGEDSRAVRDRVVKARECHAQRKFNTEPNSGGLLEQQLRCFSASARQELSSVLSRPSSSCRGVSRLVSISLTVSALEGSCQVNAAHVQEAALLCLREPSRNIPDQTAPGSPPARQWPLAETEPG